MKEKGKLLSKQFPPFFENSNDMNMHLYLSYLYLSYNVLIKFIISASLTPFNLND